MTIDAVSRHALEIQSARKAGQHLKALYADRGALAVEEKIEAEPETIVGDQPLEPFERLIGSEVSKAAGGISGHALILELDRTRVAFAPTIALICSLGQTRNRPSGSGYRCVGELPPGRGQT